MALTSTTSANSPVTLTGPEQTVATEFQFFATSEVVVLADGVELVEGTHYEVTGGRGGLGAVVFLVAGPTTGAVINILRSIPYDQPTEFTRGGPLDPVLLTQVHDRIVMQQQQLQRDIAALTAAMETGDWEDVHLGLPVIPNDSITTLKLADNAVTADKIAGAAVTTSKILAANVTKAKLAADVFGTAADTACAGNDSRLSNPRTPTNHTHESNKLAQANTHETPDTDTAPTSLHHTLGTGAYQACGGADARLSDQRTPSAGSVAPGKLAAGLYAFKGRTYLTTGTAATYTPPAGVRAIEVECWGAGGGGGGVNGVSTTNYGGSGMSGGGGAYARWFTALLAASYTYSVGAGGTAGDADAGNGGTGGTTTFAGDGVSLSAGGGVGGNGMTAADTTSTTPGVDPGTATGGDINLPGHASTMRIRSSGTTQAHSKPGGSGMGGGCGVTNAAGSAGPTGATPGCGGWGGWATTNNGTNYAGGAGGNGLIIVTEYY